MNDRSDRDLELPGVELLDVGPDPVSESAVDRIDTASTNRVGAAIAVVGAIVAAVLVIGVGNSTPPIQAPDVTIEEVEPAPRDPPLTEQELNEEQQREDEFGVALGDGPGLVWQKVDAVTNTKQWYWAEGSFLTDDGTTEWTIELDASGPSASQQLSPELDHPGYRLHRLEGGRLLIPNVSVPDHLLVIRGDAGPVRAELPELTDPLASDLTETYAWLSGTIVGDRLVTNVSVYAELDVAALEARTGRDLTGVVQVGINDEQIDLYTSGPGPIPDPIPIAEAGLSDSEIDELSQLGTPSDRVLIIDMITGQVLPDVFADFSYNTDLLIGLGGELLFGWADTSGANWLSSTTDGAVWSTERQSTPRWLVNSGTQLFDFTSKVDISRSSNGDDWDSTAVPLRERERVAAGDVIVLGQSRNSRSTNGGVTVETGDDRLRLDLFEGGSRFELHGPSPLGEPLSSGWIYAPSSGAEWDWPSNELVFTDPESGEELLRVPGHAVDVAVALQNPTESIAFTRWPLGATNPEWLVTEPVEVFGEGALSVDFVSGGQQLLAIVTTVDGYELHITDVAEQP